MAKRISRYDLTPEIRRYIQELIEKANELSVSFTPIEKDLSDAEVVYVRNRGELDAGIGEGLVHLYTMQRYKIKEQNKLRAGTKHYYKKYYIDGKIEKIESHSDGKVALCYFASYHDNTRYLIPFGENNKPYPYTYTYALKRDGDVTEEYMVQGFQIVYSRYRKIDQANYDYLYINYVPNGTYPILGYETGVFEVTDTINYKQNYAYSWYMEFDAERKGLSFDMPDIHDIVNFENK